VNFDEILEVARKIADIAQKAQERPQPQQAAYNPATAEQMTEWGWKYIPQRGEGYEWEAPWPFTYRLGFNSASWLAPLMHKEISARSNQELQKVAWKGHGSLCNKRINPRINRRSGYNSLMECDCWVKTMIDRARQSIAQAAELTIKEKEASE
jgi:hypothetical protein